MTSVCKVKVIRQVHLLFFDGADQPLGISVLGGFADLGHADRHMGGLEQIGVSGRGILDALIRMMDLRRAMGKEITLVKPIYMRPKVGKYIQWAWAAA